MTDGVNIYCDESCHLQNDRCRVMVLGAMWCPEVAVVDLSAQMRSIKERHGLSRWFEVKWIKASPSKEPFFHDLIDFFFDRDDLHFRGVLVTDKAHFLTAAEVRDHDDWYYDMAFRMLDAIIDPDKKHNIYFDIKDTRSENKRRELEKILRTSCDDRNQAIIAKVQQIRSQESELLQLADLFIGAIGHSNRQLHSSKTKSALVRHVQERSGKSLDQSTWVREKKLNLFCWSPNQICS